MVGLQVQEHLLEKDAKMKRIMLNCNRQYGKSTTWQKPFLVGSCINASNYSAVGSR